MNRPGATVARVRSCGFPEEWRDSCLQGFAPEGDGPAAAERQMSQMSASQNSSPLVLRDNASTGPHVSSAL